MSKTIKMKSLSPNNYRLFKKKTGEVVLQGAFPYKYLDEHGDNVVGSAWEDIPTQTEEEE